MIVLAAKFTVRPEAREEALDAATAMLAPSRSEPGCRSYTFYCDPLNPNDFLFFEEWESMAALQAHFATAGFQAFIAAMPARVAGPIEVKMHEVASTTQM